MNIEEFAEKFVDKIEENGGLVDIVLYDGRTLYNIAEYDIIDDDIPDPSLDENELLIKEVMLIPRWQFDKTEIETVGLDNIKEIG